MTKKLFCKDEGVSVFDPREKIMEKEAINDMSREKEVPQIEQQRAGVKPRKTDARKIRIFQKNIQEMTVFHREVVGAQRDEVHGDIMLVDFDGTRGIIPKSEADADIEWRSLIGFIGRKIPMIITAYDAAGDRLVCSRKEAQNSIKSKVVSDLSTGEAVDAKIVSLASFGAYVEIHGVTGILKNEDFSDDHITVGDVFRAGETLEVKLLRVNKAGKLSFKTPVMYKKASMPEVSNFEVDQVVKGTVVGTKDWGFYVRLLPGVDALCPLPREEEVFVGSHVVIKITQVADADGKLRIRGRLVKFLTF